MSSSWMLLFTVLLVSWVEAFTPTRTLTWLQFAPRSRTHQIITEDSHKAVAKDFIFNHPGLFPDGIKTMSRKGFRQATRDFRKYVTGPDFGAYDPSQHFDAETFDPGNRGIITLLRRIRQDIRANDITTARMKTGVALHAIQDFYSHSNWVEMSKGLARIHSQLGVESSGTIKNMAGAREKCCDDCIGKDCAKNSLVIDVKGKLTSGYYKKGKDGAMKPADNTDKPANTLKQLIEDGLRGKCSHGGPWDETSFVAPIGGINKDTTSSRWSPHESLHFEAAEAALQTSTKFIKSIRENKDDKISDDQFAKFLGLTHGKTLCFVIDTTGSMSDEIDAVRQVTIGIVLSASAAAGGERPSNYVLVPFNDPGYGPLMVTTDPMTMIGWLQALTADGGGDTPELAMHGLKLAVDFVIPGSTCYTYTDAPAKDTDLYPYVLSVAVDRHITIVNFITDLGFKRRRRSTSRQKRSVDSYYDELARLTGGQIYELSKGETSDVSELVIGLETRKSRVTLYTSTGTYNSAYFNITIPVDHSVSDVYLVLTGPGFSIIDIQVTSPNGLPYYDFNKTLATYNALGYNFTSLTPGNWIVNASLSSPSSFSTTVTATSIVNFDYHFAVETDGPHGGYKPISGSPVGGADYVIVVTVWGATDPANDNSTGLVKNITSLQFVSLAGDLLADLPLNELESLKTFVVDTPIPTTAFRIAIRGIDYAGNVIQRYDTTLINPAVTNIAANVTSISQPPGSSVDVELNITSSGNLSPWTVYVTDSENFYSGSPSIAINAGIDQPAIVVLNFAIPSNATYGSISTVTVSVSNGDPTSVDNFYVFYATVATAERQGDDPTSPVIQLISQLFPCQKSSPSCSLTTWSAQFQVRDVLSGLRSVTVTSKAPQNESTVSIESFVEGTQSNVTGNYSSTCCYPTATIRAIGGSGEVSELVIGNSDGSGKSRCVWRKPKRNWSIIQTKRFLRRQRRRLALAGCRRRRSRSHRKDPTHQ